MMRIDNIDDSGAIPSQFASNLSNILRLSIEDSSEGTTNTFYYIPDKLLIFVGQVQSHPDNEFYKFLEPSHEELFDLNGFILS